MQLSSGMLEQLNIQMNKEYFSAYLYLSMSAWCSSENLDGFANWLRVQANEEIKHGMKIYQYIIDRGDKVELKAIEGPQTKFDSPLAIFKQALEHEIFVTTSINKIMENAKSIKDYATEEFLLWFVKEQVEEEESTGKIVAKLEMAADCKSCIFNIDRELSKRKDDDD